MRNPYFQKVWLLWFSISWNESPLSLLSSLFFLLSLSTSHFGEWLSATIFPCPCSYFLLVYAWLSSPYILMYQNTPTEWMYWALDINIGWISITQALHRLHIVIHYHPSYFHFSNGVSVQLQSITRRRLWKWLINHHRFQFHKIKHKPSGSTKMKSNIFGNKTFLKTSILGYNS